MKVMERKHLYLIACVGWLLCLSPEVLGDIIADSVADWSTSGTQGARGWYNGYYNDLEGLEENYFEGGYNKNPERAYYVKETQPQVT